VFLPLSFSKQILKNTPKRTINDFGTENTALSRLDMSKSLYLGYSANGYNRDAAFSFSAAYPWSLSGFATAEIPHWSRHL
jgi:hypothetical protein